MSVTTTLILVLVAAVIAVLVGQKCNVNMGVIAFVFGAILAIYFGGTSYSNYYAYWPTKVMIQLLGISFFFGFFEATGTVKYLASHILYAIKGQVKLLPFVLFLISVGFGYLGVSALAYNTLLLPIIVALCMSCNRHPMFLLLCYGVGTPTGMVSPLGIAGVISRSILSEVVGPEMAATIMPRLYINTIIWSLVMLAIVYIVFRGWGLEVSTENIDLMNEKPAPATRDQKLVLAIMAICVLFLIVPGLLGYMAFGNKGDIGFVYLAAGIVCGLLKLGDSRQIMQRSIPWGIIVMVGGFAALLSVATNAGAVDMLSNFLNNNVSPSLAAPLFNLVCGIISVFSDAIGVVIPSFTPVAGIMAMSGAVSATAIVSAVVIGGMATAAAPLSTGGAQYIAYMPENLGKTVFWGQMAVAFIGLIVSVVLCFVGVYG